MLKPEHAEARLKEFKVEKSEERQLARVAELPDKSSGLLSSLSNALQSVFHLKSEQPTGHAPGLRAIALGLMGRSAEGIPLKTENYAAWKAKEAAALQMEALTSEERLQIFSALAPKVARHLEGAWQLFPHLRYQGNHSRKAFRAPGYPDAWRGARQTTLQWILELVGQYDQDVVWLAAWVPYLGWHADLLGILFTAAINAGGDEGEAVFETLIASAKGEHEIGAMGRHVTRALLTANRPDGWEFIEKYLLAAQRQEGLRQVVMETVDEAHPQAFRRMLDLIQSEDLLRFSAVLRAVDTWFGLGWDVVTVKFANAALADVARFLDDSRAREHAFATETGQTLYLAFCALAYEDAIAATEAASRLLGDPNLERRFVAAHFLAQVGLQPSRQALLPALEDPDLRIAWTAFQNVAFGHNYYQEDYEEKVGIPDLFERMESLIARLPQKSKECEPLIWPWLKITVDRGQVAGRLANCLGKRSPKRLIPYIPMMESYARSQAVEKIGKQKKWDAETRDTLFAFVGDATELVRDNALAALKNCDVKPEEAARLEKLLTRKAAGLRRGVLSLLAKQPDADALVSADRLLAVTNPQQRMAGLELMQEMVKANRKVDACRERVRKYQANQKVASDSETRIIAALLDEEREVPTLENALGLMNPSERTPVIPPRSADGAVFVSEAALACLKSLNKLLDKHKETPIRFQRWDGEAEDLLGNVTYGFPRPEPKTPLEDDLPRLPLREVWEAWWIERKSEMRDPDGCELARLLAAIEHQQHLYGYTFRESNYKDAAWYKDALKRLYTPLTEAQAKHQRTVEAILQWLIRIHPPKAAGDLLLDAVATTCAFVPEEELKRVPEGYRWNNPIWIDNEALMAWLAVTQEFKTLCPAEWQEAHRRRYWRLRHWMDAPLTDAGRNRPELDELLDAYRLGEANEADLMDQLLGPRPANSYGRSTFEDLHRLTGRKTPAVLTELPLLKAMVDRCRERIIEVELDRGDILTASTYAALALRVSGDLSILAKVLPPLGKDGFARAAAGGTTRSATFSHLVQTAFPGPNDDFEAFAQAMRDAKIGTERLVELAVYAPQWARHVEAVLGWPELEEAVWWIHTHTKDTGWTVDAEIREEWTAASSERTPLAAQELLDGAVDVAWFHRVYTALGPERWKTLDSAAKYASGGGGHKRAQLFADAMLGKRSRAELTNLVLTKRNQDALRALGLIPLGSDGDMPQQDVLTRYKTIQEFLRQSRQFGSQRQASEKLAASISMQNLARTAGYADPNRLEWAMEAEAVADLAGGPLTVTEEEVAVTLAINALGKPELTVTKSSKPLKAIPPKVKKLPAVAELVDRKTEIDRQASRMRLSLEASMIRGDRFTGDELRELLRHPVLAPMLRSLVFVGEGFAGYPVDGGRELESHDGSRAVVGSETLLAIAHPYDLLGTNAWHLWQRECFLHERIQPFKQVFRELYVLTAAEQVDGTMTRRYEGHQVQPQKALAILGKRGWVAKPDEGVRRTYHEAGLTALVEFEEGYFTPTEVEGLTLARVGFVKRGEWKPLPLGEVPPRLFSETMRDLDLIVSVAHMGGVDPEASRSTTEMREALLRETCNLLKLTNVRFQGVHALIDGHLGTYTVHLGSAVVHIQPGGHLCIVPVPSQHRGRLFLPFADDDPKTAEVVSKVVLLAKDKEIQDPTILEQILPRR